jgi:hypothetical protein
LTCGFCLQPKIIRSKPHETKSGQPICDHDCVISVTIEKRTAKTVTATVRGEQKTFRVAEYDGAEFIKPWGSYSMAPVIRATNGSK